MVNRTDDQAGFSLIELLIAVALLGVISSQMFLVLSTQKRTYVGSTRTLDVQESARLVTDLIAFDTRNAGLMVPRYAAVSSVDGGDEASDRLCLSDPDIFAIPASTVEDGFWNLRVERFVTTPVITPSGTIKDTAEGADSWKFTLDTLNVDPDSSGPVNDYAVTRGIILSNGVDTFCSRIVELNPLTNTIEIAHDPGALGVGGVSAVPAIVYEVEEDTLELRRNDVVLSSAVEDLQVEYWIDKAPPNCNGIIDGPEGQEWPVHDLNEDVFPARKIDRMRLVRVSVVARADLEDEASGARVNRYTRPAVANRNASVEADGFRRRRFSTSVTPHNMLYEPTKYIGYCPFTP